MEIDILTASPKLNECQRRVLAVLSAHRDHVFSMAPEDIDDLIRWVTSPESAEPPTRTKNIPGEAIKFDVSFRDPASASPEPKEYRVVVPDVVVYSPSTIRWALSTLAAKGLVGTTRYERRTYYGHPDAITVLEAKIPEIAQEARVGKKLDSAKVLTLMKQYEEQLEAAIRGREDYAPLHEDILRFLKMIGVAKSEYKDVAVYPKPPEVRQMVIMTPDETGEYKEVERIPTYSDDELARSRLALGKRLQSILMQKETELEAEYKLRENLKPS